MIVINSYIFQIQDIKEEDILNAIQKLGIDDFINVSDTDELNYTIQSNRFQKIILFTNFPPNHFYKLNHFDFKKYEFEAIPNFAVNKYYSFSTLFFYNLLNKYQEQIVEVNFITSAKKEILDDSYFSKVGNGLHTIVQRKREWFSSEFDYNFLLKNFILDRLYAAVNSTSTRNHEKLLLQELMSNYFCQN